MKLNIQLTTATLADYPVIQNMARFYTYDLSRECGFISQDWAIPADGLYQCFDLKLYFEDATHRAYLIRVNEELAGFALLNQIGSCVDTDWNMGEFFILAKFQGKGIGSDVAQIIFDRYPGIWEVNVMPENGTALSFWRKTIGHYMQAHYCCETKLIRPTQVQPYRVVFSFDTRLRAQPQAEQVMRPLRITGLNHLTLAVTDLEKSFAFYRDNLGFQPLVKWDKGAYFLAHDLWFCLNVDEKRISQPCYTHYAFTVSSEQFILLSKQLLAVGIPTFKNNISEGESFYFLDPDGHKLEIHVGNWQSRLQNKQSDLGSWKQVEWFI